MRRTLHLLYGLVVFLLGTISLADDVIIDRVEAVSHGSKSSIIIRYSGTERIQFFAIDAADDLLTLDFPGVVSDVDFSQISTEQLVRVDRVQLDPNSPRGVGIHFHTQPDVAHEIFEGEPGALIVYLEHQPSPVDEPMIEPAPEKAAAVTPGDATPSAPRILATHEIPGRPGQDRLYGATLDLLELGGRISLQMDKQPEVSTFSLPDPDRFVVDLKGVVCGLDQHLVEVDSAFLHRVRIRQFRVEPEPITRMVLDLKNEVEVETVSHDSGLTLHFASTGDALAAIGSSELPAQPATQEVISDDVHEAEAEPPMESVEVALSDDPNPSTGAPVHAPPVDSVETVEGPSSQSEDPDTTLAQWIAQDPSETKDAPLEAVEEIIQPDPGVQVANLDSDAPVQAPLEEESQEPEKEGAALQLADDVDLQIHRFQQDDGSLYGQMKDTPRNHHSSDPILVTNQTIASVLELGETRNLQTEEGPGRESLFQQVEEFTDGYETIGGGAKKYRGFEIQKIDVKDANVVDLLRFLADQVGFNLYVDPSVQNLKATYSFRNIPWDQAMDIILRNANLDWEFENGVLRVATTAKFKQEAQERRALQEERELAVPVETVTFPLSYAKVAEVVPIVEQYLSLRGTILQDERTNTLIIEDIPKRMVAIRTLIRRLDTRVPQVSIESRIVETTKRFLRELGIQWGLSAEYSPEMGTQTGVTFPQRVNVGGPRIGQTDPFTDLQGGYAVNFPVISENPSGVGLSLGNFLDTFQLDISLQMLESDGLGQIISAPKVTTQNNMTAFIKNGQRIPIQTVQRGTITVRYIDAVLELEVTPHITSEKTIIMDLVVDKSEPDFTRTVLGNPIINVRRAETRVLVKDGGTTVIGGIFVLNEQAASAGVPGVRKLPIIKYLFGSDLESYENQELLIFITPRIIKF